MNKVREWYSENARPYRPPRAVNADDTADIQEIDEIKLHELKEVNYRIFWCAKMDTKLFNSASCYSIKIMTGSYARRIYVQHSRQWEWRWMKN